jgi:hypothetical protein
VPALGDGSTIDAAQSAALRSHDLRRLARVRQGLGPGSQDAKGNGPLHLACQPTPQAAASLEFLREVLSWAPLLDRPNSAGWTALDLAVLFMPAPAVRLLAEFGACESGSSLRDALLLAANYERADVTAAVLASGRVATGVEEHHNEALSFALRFERHAAYLLELDGLAGRFPVLDREVANSEQTDERVLKLLASSKDRPTLRAVARNPNTPTETLFALAPEFPRPFFCNPVFDWLLLENPDRILEMGKGVIRKILRVKDCPASMIEWAVERGSDADRLAVIRRGDASPEILRLIAEKSTGRVQALAIASNPEAPESSLKAAVGIDVAADRLIAARLQAGEDLLDRLSDSGDLVVRQQLLQNPRISEAARRKLAGGGLVVHLLRRR